MGTFIVNHMSENGPRRVPVDRNDGRFVNTISSELSMAIARAKPCTPDLSETAFTVRNKAIVSILMN